LALYFQSDCLRRVVRLSRSPRFNAAKRGILVSPGWDAFGGPKRLPHRFRRGAQALVVVAALAASLALVLAPSATSAISSGTTYTVVNQNSGKCVDARAAATANGTAVQQYACNGTGAQQWRFTATSSGYFQVGVSTATGQVWDDSNVSSADGSLIHLWTYGGGTNQQWLPVQEASGNYHFVNRFSGKCLDVPSASTADSVQLQQWTCNGTAAQSFSATPVGGGGGTNPNFGPNVIIFDPSQSASTIQTQLNNVFNSQQTNQFGTQRYALLFKPGTYNVDANVGFYTQVSGLGLSPDNVTINGAVHIEVERRLPRRLQDRQPGAVRLAAAVAVAQLPVGKLDRLELEHGLRRRRQRAGEQLPEPALHDGRHDAGRPREAVPLCGRRRRLERLRPGPALELERDQLGRDTGRHLDADRPVLHRQVR
jgi:hypothetical protein